jgi:hypothetical protein
MTTSSGRPTRSPGLGTRISPPPEPSPRAGEGLVGDANRRQIHGACTHRSAWREVDRTRNAGIAVQKINSAISLKYW